MYAEGVCSVMGNQGIKSSLLKIIDRLRRHFTSRIMSIFTRKIASGSSADWASLPDDVLDLILHKLVGLSDYVRFGAVCKSWHSSSLLQKQFRRITRTNQIPFLWVPSCQSKPRWNLYSVISQNIGDFEQVLPYPYERFCGSSYGWLATYYFGVLILINPFSSSTSNSYDLTVIRLPLFPLNYLMDCQVEKVILSCDPSFHPHDYTVVASFSYHRARKLAYINPSRDESWRLLETESVYSLLDLIYYKNHIYGLGLFGELISFNIDEDHNRPTRVLIVKNGSMGRMFTKDYIVDASDGGLLLVQQRACVSEYEHKHKHKHKRNCTCFLILKLTSMPRTDTGFEWVEVDGLGGDALFLGDNSGVCVVASDYPGCQANSIYYICKSYNLDMGCFVSVDAGIYNCHDKSIRVLYMRSLEEKPSSCIWILPKLE